MKLRYMLFASAVSLMAAGCNESSFLDNPAQGVISDEVIENTGQVDLLTNAAYAGLMGADDVQGSANAYPTTNWSYGSVRADDAYKGGGGTGDLSDVHKIETMTVDASLGNADGKWYKLYCSVQRCNSALSLLNKMTNDQVTDRKIQIQEMKVLRAHFYFELSRLFNRIVYFEEDYDGDLATLSNVEYTRDQILEKLATTMEEAASVLPESQTDLGRINKYIATAYAAKINLYRAYQQDEETHKVTSINKQLLQKVADECDVVINSHKYGLLDNFQDLDKVSTGDNSKEGVFQVQYSMNDGTESGGRINWSNLLNSPKGPYNGDGFFLPSQDLTDAFQTDENGLPLFDTYYKNHYDTWNADENKSENTIAAVDPRLDFIVGRPGITWKTYKDTPCEITWVRDVPTYGSHCCKRFFVSPESSEMYQGWPWGASGLNWNIIRYSNVLLWKAEALIEMGQNLDEARQLINTIRSRAAQSQYWVKDFNDDTKYAANYKIGMYPQAGWTQDYARKALRYETRLETAMEGERFFDLVRWGIAAETMNGYFAREKGTRVYYQNSKFTEGRDEYFPISSQQYNFSNGTYKQNPGYGNF